MSFVVTSARSSRSKCFRCKEPIIKKEGILKQQSNYSWCYTCSLNIIKEYINMWKGRKKALKKNNHISMERLKSLKVARLL